MSKLRKIPEIHYSYKFVIGKVEKIICNIYIYVNINTPPIYIYKYRFNLYSILKHKCVYFFTVCKPDILCMSIYIICITGPKNQQNNLLHSIQENILNDFITIDIA